MPRINKVDALTSQESFYLMITDHQLAIGFFNRKYDWSTFLNLQNSSKYEKEFPLSFDKYNSGT